LADRIEHHGVRFLCRVGLPFEARLAGIARAGEIDPRLRDLILQGKCSRCGAGRDPRLGLAHVVEGKDNLGAMEGCNAAIDRSFIRKDVIVDGRLALLELAVQRRLGAGAVIDWTALTSLAATPQALVDAVNNAFMYGQMPASMQTQILSAVNAITGTTAAVYKQRAQAAVYLTVSSSYYNVEH